MAKTKVGVGWLLMLVAAVIMIGMVALQPGTPEAANWGDKDFQGFFGTTATIADLNRLHSSTATATEINYLTGVTSNIQTQLDTLTTGKLVNTLTDKYLFVGNASNVPTGVALSGDATITNAGVMSLAANSVDTSELVDNSVADNDILNATMTKQKTAHWIIYINTASGGGVQNMTVYNASVVGASDWDLYLKGHDFKLGTLNSLTTDGFGNVSISINSPEVGNYAYVEVWM